MFLDRSVRVDTRPTLLPDEGTASQMRETRGLVLAPSDAMNKPVVSAIRESLGELGVQVYRFDDLTPGVHLTNAVLDAVRSADLVVVDVTRPNPNVFYELGFAHALRKPTILVRSSDSTEPVPPDLSGLLYIMYDSNNLPRFSHDLKRASAPLIQREDEA